MRYVKVGEEVVWPLHPAHQGFVVEMIPFEGRWLAKLNLSQWPNTICYEWADKLTVYERKVPDVRPRRFRLLRQLWRRDVL